MEKTKKIAIYIDSDNISYNNAEKIIEVMSQKGTIVIKEIVADWTKISSSKIVTDQIKEDLKSRYQNIDGWRDKAAKFSMTPIQQFVYVPGKNTNDIAVTIHAMKDLYEKQYIDIFCLVANDSDFTRLAQEIKKHDKEVIGMGLKKAAIQEFVNAFTEYVYLDEEEDVTKTELPIKQSKSKTNGVSAKCLLEADRLSRLENIIIELIDESGRALYSRISSEMKKYFPDFIYINYGHKNFRALMKSLLPFLPKFIEEEYKSDISLLLK